MARGLGLAKTAGFRWANAAFVGAAPFVDYTISRLAQLRVCQRSYICLS